MQEFSSVTASSYDADSLAPMLAEKSADGWSVISIVAAGTNIVAYLEREAEPATESVIATEVEEEAESADDAVVDEPAGWAVAPESDTTAEPAADDSLAGLVAEVETEEPAAEPAEVVAEPAAAAAATAAESAVPAGWYADPSGRFELRYWDGSAWTEHVSRAGQQFTDPPVA